MLTAAGNLFASAGLPAADWRLDVVGGLFVLAAIAVAVAQQTLP